MILLIKTETLRKRLATCTSGLSKLKLDRNDEKVSAELQLYRKLLPQAWADLNEILKFSFRSAETIHCRQI